MKRLQAYKQACADFEFAKETVNQLDTIISDIGSIAVSSSITINRASSDKQLIYAVGILNAQLQACKELGVDSKEVESTKLKLIEINKLYKDRAEWANYYTELCNYKNSIYKLLSNDELFELLEAPAKP